MIGIEPAMAKRRSPALRLHRRRSIRVALWMFPLFLMAARLPAQTGDAAVDKNQQKAHAVLNAMVEALGGQRWLDVTTTMRQGSTAGFYQGKPTGATADYTEFQKFPDQSQIELGKKRDVFEILNANQGWEITYRGKKAFPADQLASAIRSRDHSIQVAVRVWLKDPTTILIYGGQNLVERRLADRVTLLNAQNDSITIETDAETHLPLRRSWQWRDPLYKDKNTDAEEYDDYHMVGGLPTPYAVTRFHNDDMSNQRFLYRAAYNVQLPPAAFDVDAAVAKLKK